VKFFTFSWGNNYIAVRGFLRALGHDVTVPVAISSEVMKTGVEISPSFMCFSGKIVLGQLWHMLQRGNNNFAWMSSLGIEACRCADTKQMLELIALKKFPQLNACRFGGNRFAESLENVRSHFPGTGALRHNYAYMIFFIKLELISIIEKRCLDLRWRAFEPKQIKKMENDFLRLVDKYNNPLTLSMTGLRFYWRILRTRVKKIKPYLKIGIIGGEHIIHELDSIMARIKNLAEEGVKLEWRSGFRLIARTSNIDHPMKGRDSLEYMQNIAKDYLHSETWGTELFSCARAIEFAEEGYDGLIHIYSFGCMPQTAIKPALQKISNDKKIPVLSLPIGEKFSEAGIETRLEAFIDILKIKKESSSINKEESHD